MHSSRWPRFTGPLESYASGFDAELGRLGFTPLSAFGQLLLMAHLSRWLMARNLQVEALTSGLVEEYLAERRAAGYTNYRTAKAMRPLLDYLRALGVTRAAPARVPSDPAEVLLADYRRYLLTERGLTGPGARGYVDLVRPFVVARATASGLELSGLDTAAVVDFMRSVVAHRPAKTAQRTASALRSLLGFLHQRGLASALLGAAVPKVAVRTLADVPRRLEPWQVQALLDSCDTATAAGLRDRAMLLLMTRLGMRAGEVAGLDLEDLHWRAGVLVVRGKNGRIDQLPLPPDAGTAVVDYLKRGRPATADGRTVFCRILAPHRKLTTTGVTQAVAAAAKRAGLGVIYAHRLRHSAAGQVLDAGGPLSEVGQLLRHQRPATTVIYLKIDLARLQMVARPWPVPLETP